MPRIVRGSGPYSMSLSTASTRALRLACALACIPSGGALLAKMYGLASMQAVTLWLFVPCAIALVAVWAWGRRGGPTEVADALAIGALGGLLGTFGYDLIRVPFLLGGLRVFAPIEAYGVWIAGAAQSSVWTLLTGWAYHFSNGITFGIMYALVARGRHWGWGVAWAMLLETIALFSPFGPIFNLSSNPVAIGIAYLGHVAYGLPLGLLVQRWDRTRSWLESIPRGMKVAALVFCVLALLAPALRSEAQARDTRRIEASFRVEGLHLNPDWVRVDRGDPLGLVNPSDTTVYLDFMPDDRSVVLTAGERATVVPDSSGIFGIHVRRASGRTHSSFLIVEPVEDAR